MRFGRSFGAAIAALVLAVAPSALAQKRPGPHADKGFDAPVRTLFGVPMAKHLLASDDPVTRLRAVDRLASIGTTEAIDALVEAVEQGSAASRDVRVRLEAVRVLAGYARRDTVRQLLVRETLESGNAEGSAARTLLGPMLRQTAALALARSGDKKSLTALAGAVAQGGTPAGEAATRALLAYPPASLDPLFEGKKRLPIALVQLVATLGDLRAIGRLRAMLEEPDGKSRTDVAIALAKLGDDAAKPIARDWATKTPEPRLIRASAEVFAALDAPEAFDVIAALIKADATRDAGLELAVAHPTDQGPLGAAIVDQLKVLTDDEVAVAFAALGRIGDARAVAALSESIAATATTPQAEQRATRAAYALAMTPGEAARRVFDDRLGAPGARGRTLLRAAVVRALALDDAPGRLGDLLEAALAAQGEAGASDRAIGTFGLVALGARSVERALADGCTAGRCAPEIVAAAARGAIARGDPDGLEPLLGLLADDAAVDKQPWLTSAAGIALLVHPDGGTIATSKLAAWAEEGGPIAPLAARALPSRDHPALRGRIKRLLEGSDPVVRAHVALGLALDPEPSAVSMLTAAYRFEDDATVRRAVVRALARRTEIQRVDTLTLARDLDPDPAVRSLARVALDGGNVDVVPLQRSGWSAIAALPNIAFVSLVPSEGKPSTTTLEAARLVRQDGVAMPLVADPDGVLLMPGLGPGRVTLTLATPPPARDAPAK